MRHGDDDDDEEEEERGERDSSFDDDCRCWQMLLQVLNQLRRRSSTICQLDLR